MPVKEDASPTKRVKRLLEMAFAPEPNTARRSNGMAIGLRFAQMTGYQATVADIAQRRLFPAATIDRKRTARMEMTARRRVEWRRNFTSNRFKTTTPRIDPGYFSQ